MAEADLESGGRAVQAATAGALAALGDTELSRWEVRCRAAEAPDHPPWPEAESRGLVEAVLAGLFDADGSLLEPAARAWAHSVLSLPVLVRRLTCLRELLAVDGLAADPAIAARLQRVLDKVTTLATEAALAELEDAALTDPLTGAGNRRALDAAGRVALAGAARTGAPLSLVVVDLDGLKAINDTGGHAAGDQALAGLADAMRAALRDTDQLFRIGGDEFVVLLPMAPAATVAELMRRAEQLGAPSFSWGVASAPVDAADMEGLLQMADGRLYAARRAAGYYEGRRTTRAVTPGAPPAAPQTPPAARRAMPSAPHRHRPLVLALSAVCSVGAVVGLVAVLPGSRPVTTSPPPAVTPGARLPGQPAPGGPPPPSGPAPSGQAGTTGTSSGPAGGPAPSGSGTGGGSTAPPPPPSTTTTAASAGSNGSLVTLPPQLPGSGLLGG